MNSKMMIGWALLSVAACSPEPPARAGDGVEQLSSMSVQDATRLVKPFYDLLGGDATIEEVRPSYHEDWVSYYDNQNGRSMADTVGFVSGPLAKMVPDLKWSIQEVYVTKDTIVVRGEATGTPAGQSFMGSPIAGGKSFRFMSIDIHELEAGKIARTYHVEDWMGAVRQVAGEGG